MVKKKAKVVDRNDGWGNVFSQLGVRGKDKMTGATIAWCPLGYATEEALYAQDDMASKIADALPEDSMRQEFILKGYEDDVVKKFWKRWYQLKLTERVVDGWTQGRIYGGAAVVIVNNDKLDVPFDPKLKRPILAMQVLNRYELPYKEINKNFASENFGMPEYYTVSPRNFTNTSFNKVHHSRVVRFDGAKLPTNIFVNNSYWHDSIFTKLWSPLKSYNLSFAGAATAMQDWRVGVFKVKNLAALFANGQEDKVAKRIGAIDLGKSIARSIIIDSDETYDYANTSFSGADSMLDRMSGRLKNATDIPGTKLFGDSPTGLGGSGRHEENNWYDYVSAKQNNYLKPRLLVLASAVLSDMGMDIVEDFDIVFPSLKQMTELEQAELHHKQAQADDIYAAMGALDPAEVRSSRFGTGEFNLETNIDESLDVKPANVETT